MLRSAFSVQRSFCVSENVRSHVAASTSAVFCASLLVFLFDDPGGRTGNDRMRRDIFDHDRTGCDHGSFSDAYALDDDRVGADEHIVFDDDRNPHWPARSPRPERHRHRCDSFSRRSPRPPRTAPISIIVPSLMTAPSVDDRPHHDHRPIADLHLIADDRTRFDAGVDVFHIQQRNGAVAAGHSPPPDR